MIPLKNSSRMLSGLLAGALVTSALAFSAPAAHAVPAKPGAKVLILNDPEFVDTTDDAESVAEGNYEGPNMIAVLTSYGHAVTSFRGTDGAALAAALKGKDTFVIPELENGYWAQELSDSARAALVNWARAGGTLVVAADTDQTLNDLFGFRMEWRESGASTNTAPVGSSFRAGPARLPDNDMTITHPVASLPAGAVVQYTTATGEDGRDASVFTVPTGKGTVVSLGWDWWGAAPVVTGDDAQDGGWNEVLDISVRTGLKKAAAPVVKAPSNVFRLPAKGKANVKNGSLTLKLSLPGAGKIQVASARKGVLKSGAKAVGPSGKTSVQLKPSKKTLKKLRAQLKKKKVASTKVKVKVTYTPKGGKARTVTKTYVLKLKKKSRK
ncbi:hypothetical protein [Aeromicrobium duanguangcaii]|uniref:hypothetical protein n=1 Tax=Aeromicrobium duanguangcaii TaxID=2968086 RepID=UPI002017977D|nr:hypothetical protein [Aeromicrobium duanguangcaii]MCL3837545.1 hypothetical protein [Aeromicrobium duanguangcaii]